MSDLLSFFKQQKEYRSIAAALSSQNSKRLPLFVTGLSDGAKQFFYAALAYDRNNKNVPMLAVLPQEKEISRLASSLEQFGLTVKIYPLRDFTIRNMTTSHEFEHERLAVLHSILSGGCDVVLTVPDAAMQYTVPQNVLEARVKKIRLGESYDIDSLCELFTESGYARVDMVESSGQFSRRGDILDLFTPAVSTPVRMEFFGNEIDRMSYFDIISQRRTEDLTEFDFLPVREVMISRAQSERLAEMIVGHAKKIKDHHIREELKEEIEELQSGRELKSADKYFSYIYPDAVCLFDYFEDGTIVVYEDYNALMHRVKSYAFQEKEAAKSAIESGLAISRYIEHSLSAELFDEMLRTNKCVLINSFAVSMKGMELSDVYTFATRHIPGYSDNIDLLCDELRQYRDSGYDAVLFCEGMQNATNIKNILIDNGLSAAMGLDHDGIRLVLAPELSGFEARNVKFVCMSVCRTGLSGRKNGEYNKGGASKKEKDPSRILTYADLTEGDFVVHTVHGIGIYLGVDSLVVAGVRRDFVKIKYAGDDMLYLPCNQLDSLSKYIGATENGTVKLSKMGGGEWGKTKAKVKSAAKEMAKELIALYAERTRREGFAFARDDALASEFADTFEYVETQGQLEAIEDIRRDMESPWPMDRLLCGDVGYGKTEVALRAAFKAVINSKQVAILVPTTILAMQHYQTIMSRMRGFPVRVDMLSRFRTAKQQEHTVSELSKGRIDIVVGTHRLLSQDIKFNDLGLVIVDEEQRFGVAQKEKLKKLVKNVDVLTLTATPIPRTLNMAMSGIRDMSILEEAPGDRYPVQTYVCEYDDDLISEAIKKELRRGGQVFYLCNNINRFDAILAKVSKFAPDAVIATAHGQMDKDMLSDVWEKMISGDIDIMICTTIIETGVDLANANTLIIENADAMGLSQLHQIRGRVGRSSRRAYAYFTYPKNKVLTEVSEKRLDAIRDFTEFGAGFKIAMRDLEIRGAGDLLGAEQHGNLTSVGYELYMRLLNEAILEEKGESVEKHTECTVDFNIDAYIPESYISSQNSRIEFYKKISLIRSEEDMSDIIDEIVDRYGNPPKCVSDLIKISLIRALGSDADVKKVEYRNGAVILFSDKIDLQKWSKVVQVFKGRMLISGGAKPYISCRTLKNERIFDLALRMLNEYKTGCKGSDTV